MGSIKNALKKIKKESESPELLSEIVYFSTKNLEMKKSVFKLLRAAIKYVCLMDFYYETLDKKYKKEFIFQREKVYKLINTPDKQKLRNLEKKLMLFWNYERKLLKKIKDNKRFKDKDIKEYILRKSEDSKFYFTLVNFKYKLPKKLQRIIHLRQALNNLIDDLKDYDEDIKDNQPNILILYFMKKDFLKDKLPLTAKEASSLIKGLKIKKEILNLGKELAEECLKYKEIDNFPILKLGIKEKLNLLKITLKK